MKELLGNTLRSMKNLFVEPIPDFGFDTGSNDTRPDPLFDPIKVETSAAPIQPSNQEAVLKALAQATENYYTTDIAPLVRKLPSLRYKLKQVQIRETADNMHVLAEFKSLSPAILAELLDAIIDTLPCAQSIDKTDSYGLSIVPDAELAGRAVVMFANVGQSKIAIHFYFGGEMVRSQPTPAAVVPDQAAASEHPADVAGSFHLKLIDRNGARELVIAKFPAMIGSAAKADLPVEGQYVSGQHLLLNWDPELRCVYLTDRSTHGTFMKNGRKLACGERVNLLGDGGFCLTNQADAPRFEFWSGSAPGQGTRLMPPEQCDAAPDPVKLKAEFPARQADIARMPAAEVKPIVKPIVRPIVRPEIAAQAQQDVQSIPPVTVRPVNPGNLEKTAIPAQNPAQTTVPPAKAATPHPAGQPQAGIAPDSQTGRSRAAQPTRLTAPATARPLVWLQVRTAQKRLETWAITALPYTIGREFGGEGFLIDESYLKVSRIHLKILEQLGNGFGVKNESLPRPDEEPQRSCLTNLTVGEKGAESKQFLWQPQDLGSAGSDGGWRVLGASRLDEESVEVRLLTPDSFEEGQS